MITKTIGTGGDYATIYAALQYLNTLGPDVAHPATDDVTFNQVGVITETDYIGRAVWFSSFLGGHTITWNFSFDLPVSLSAPYGSAVFRANGGIFIITNINIVDVGGTKTNLLSMGPTSTSYSGTFILNGFKIIGRNTDIAHTGITTGYFNKEQVIKIYRGYVFGCGNIGIQLQSSGNGSSVGEKIVENVSVYHCGYFGTDKHGIVVDDSSDAEWKLMNVVSSNDDASSDSWDIANPIVHSTLFNCADDDGSCSAHTGYISNIVPADEFISTDSASSNFLKLKTTGQLANGGTIPTYTTADIAGLPIPDYAGWYPIGCHVAGHKVVQLQGAVGSGKKYIIKEILPGQEVYVLPESPDLIDGESSYRLTPYESIKIVDHTTGKWSII